MKTCSRCGELKPRDAFRRYVRSADGLQAWCRPCMAEYDKRWKSENRERVRAAARARYAANPARGVRDARRSYVKTQYGLTLEEYEAILARGCSICGRDGPRMALDHDHRNGQIRDALCANCNNGVGRFHDDPTLLRAAADYLETHSEGAP